MVGAEHETPFEGGGRLNAVVKTPFTKRLQQKDVSHNVIITKHHQAHNAVRAMNCLRKGQSAGHYFAEGGEVFTSFVSSRVIFSIFFQKWGIGMNLHCSSQRWPKVHLPHKFLSTKPMYTFFPLVNMTVHVTVS